MDPTSLTQFYDNLKSHTSDAPAVTVAKPEPLFNKHTVWRIKAAKNCERLKNDCAKHIILDIYIKTLPLDKEYIDGNMGQCKHDVDCMLAQKGMNGVQYLTSCYEKTKAPLLEFLNRSIDIIGREYMKESEETFKDAEQNGIDLPPQEAPTTDDTEVQSQLVDIKEDPEYSTFIDKLKEKTINKIVNDITKIINDKKEDKKMEFDLKNESAIQESMNFLQKKFIKEGKEISAEDQEKMIGLAVRESTLFTVDEIFNQRTFKEFSTAVRLGRGVIVNESVKF